MIEEAVDKFEASVENEYDLDSAAFDFDVVNDRPFHYIELGLDYMEAEREPEKFIELEVQLLVLAIGVVGD